MKKYVKNASRILNHFIQAFSNALILTAEKKENYVMGKTNALALN